MSVLTVLGIIILAFIIMPILLAVWGYAFVIGASTAVEHKLELTKKFKANDKKK